MRTRSRRHFFSTIPLWLVLLFFIVLLFSSFIPNSGISVESVFQWLFVLLICGVASGIFLLWRIDSKTKRQLRALQISEVDSMPGVQFEKYIGGILKFQKYAVTYTPSTNDYGVDVIARRDGISYAVQIKRYNSKLDSAPIREAVAGMNYYSCDRSVVVTNSSFSTNAHRLAEVNSCILIDRNRLVSWIELYQQKKIIDKLF